MPVCRRGLARDLRSAGERPHGRPEGRHPGNVRSCLAAPLSGTARAESDMVRVNEIRYVGYGVTDLDAEVAFYRDVWGLRQTTTHQGMIYFAAQGHEEP